jgi:hypothetical protein
MDRTQAIQILIKNARFVSTTYKTTVETWDGLVKAIVNNKKIFIPGYIPYIGEKYINAKPKILIYALSQNLSEDDSISIAWAQNWASKSDMEMNKALDRQNVCYDKYGYIMMAPFDTGHLPVVAGILYYLLNSPKNKINIFELIAATNLSKFSFRDGNKTTDKENSLLQCFEWFTTKELEILNPDYIICAGDRVFNVINKGINKRKININLIKVSFPSSRVINSKYNNNKSNLPLKTDIIKSILTDSVLNKQSSSNKRTIESIINRDKYYFSAMFDCIKKQLST